MRERKVGTTSTTPGIASASISPASDSTRALMSGSTLSPNSTTNAVSPLRRNLGCGTGDIGSYGVLGWDGQRHAGVVWSYYT